MEAQHVNGWYEGEGVAYITPRVVADRYRLAEARNHEQTHHVLTALTAHGLALLATRAAGSKELSRELSNACRLVQEGVATYASLQISPPAERASSLASLPPLYLASYARVAAALDQRGLDDVARFRLARVLGARAMQTSIVSDWFRRGLTNVECLRAYLAEPDNSPDARFQKLLDTAAGLGDDELARAVGEIDWGSGADARLVPPAPPPIGDVCFEATADGLSALAFFDRMLDALAPTEPPSPSARAGVDGRSHAHATFARARMFQTAIVPQPGGLFMHDDGEFPSDWVDEADFLHVEFNDDDVPQVFSERLDPPVLLPAGRVLVEFRRPDYEAGHGVHVQPLQAAVTATELVKRGATICFGATTFVPTLVALQGSPAGRPIDPGWRALVAVGQFFGAIYYHPGDVLASVLVPVSTLEYAIGPTPWVYHAMGGLDAETWTDVDSWGVIVLRPQRAAWPMIVAPVFRDEWDRFLPVLPTITSSQDVTWEPDAGAFFPSRHALVSVYRFMRCFQRVQVGTETWTRREVRAAGPADATESSRAEGTDG